MGVCGRREMKSEVENGGWGSRPKHVREEEGSVWIWFNIGIMHKTWRKKT